ncbi:MAG: sulfatase [Acidobacteria bacterium]|nr:sulfatase [Acidobacteriota bacterium]
MRRRDLLFAPLLPLAAQPRKPNIVLFLADDLSYRDMQPFGGRQVPTPHLSALAKQGICFDAMFTATAMCAPLRQQLLTGLFPVRNGAYPNHSRVYDGVKGLPIYFRDLGYRTGRIGKKHFGPDESFPFEVIDNEEPRPGQLAPMEAFLRRDPKQPFFLWIASHQPHAPFNQGDPSAFPPEKIEVPAHLVDTPATRAILGKYYAEVVVLDNQVGAVTDLLDRTGHRDNTIFIFLSEHGSQMPFSKWTCYENGLRAGCIIRWPGRVKPGARTAAMTQYVDMLPTLLEAAGATPPSALDGKSFLPVLLGKKSNHAEYVFGVQTTKGIINGGEGYPVRSVRDRRYKYIRNLTPDRDFSCILMRKGDNPVLFSWEETQAGKARVAQFRRRPAEELYDLNTDPFELHNLAGNPSLAAIQSRLSQQLDAFMRQQGDEGPATEARARERQMQGPE